LDEPDNENEGQGFQIVNEEELTDNFYPLIRKVIICYKIDHKKRYSAETKEQLATQVPHLVTVTEKSEL
jgi:hypothetical protein